MELTAFYDSLPWLPVADFRTTLQSLGLIGQEADVAWLFFSQMIEVIRNVDRPELLEPFLDGFSLYYTVDNSLQLEAAIFTRFELDIVALRWIVATLGNLHWVDLSAQIVKYSQVEQTDYSLERLQACFPEPEPKDQASIPVSYT